MFPNFTGNSRRSRKVNLSGQRHANPFTAHALSPTSGNAASKAVAEAQATRRRRQQERDELKAAQTIQRVWRGHSSRQACRRDRRRQLEALYAQDCAILPEQRVLQALPLLAASFDARGDDSSQLLVLFAEDLHKTGSALVASGRLPLSKLTKLVDILLNVLNRKGTTPQTTVNVFTLLISLARLHPQLLSNSLASYYKLLAQFYDKNEVLPEKDKETLVQEAVLIPLVATGSTSADFSRRAYCSFASGFLPQSTHPFETLAQAIYQHIDADLLSQGVVNAYGTQTEKPTETPDQLMRLLARFIDLSRHTQRETQNSSLYLSAVYTALSYVSAHIRSRLTNTDDVEHSDDENSKAEHEYIATQLQCLVGKGEITELLKRPTDSQSSLSRQEQASLLAGYATALIQCFPSKADDIRMQFYLADLPVNGTLKPSVQFFWDACKTNPSFKRILQSPRDALQCLVERRSAAPTSLVLENKSEWVQQWRTILLFLELYTFILRLTDDDDFFSALATPGSVVKEAGPQPVSRLRSCALPLDALESLSIFLKNLAFTLHYNAAAVLGSKAIGVSELLFSGMSFDTQTGSIASGTFEVIPGLDFNAFRSTVTTAIQMLYERDSRRQFFPTDHWLMTTGFQMENVLATVVSEDQRLQQLFQDGFDAQDVNASESEDEEEEPGRILLRGRMVPSVSRAERLRKQTDKAKRNRIKATLGPTLQILHNMPYVFPFEARVKIFRQFVELDKVRRRGGSSDPELWRSRIRHRPDDREATTRLRNHSAEIRRGAVFESAFEQFWDLGEGLKEPIQITFIDEYGQQEAGIGGGVTKEFLTNALTQVLSPEEELFQYNKENSTFPNPMSLDQLKHRLRNAGEMEGTVEWEDAVNELKKRYEFIGRMIGKCMYEGILIDFVFAGFFLLKWALSATSTDSSTGYRASVNDLREMDEDLYQGMMKLKNYSGADVSDLDLDFTIEDQVSGNKDERVETVTRNLIPNGAHVRVTNQNRPLYISYVARHRLLAQPYTVTRAFLKGLNAIIDPAWLRMFNQNELQRLVGGDSSEIDVDDMRRNTVYSGVYEIGDDHEEHPTIKIFWKVVQSMDDKDRRLLLKYATSTPRAPLLGFAQLSPRFSIRFGGSDETRLPSASTCMNLLKLPMYTTEETLREKLIYAIRADVGFGFS